MLKRLKTVSMMLFLLGASTGAAFATSSSEVRDVKITQQGENATGVVKDAMGEVIGASVVVKGTQNGAMTDFEGKFTVRNVKKGDILVITYVGYKTQEVVWNGQPLNILLQEDTEMLDEVVVKFIPGTTPWRASVTELTGRAAISLEPTAVTAPVKFTFF